MLRDTAGHLRETLAAQPAWSGVPLIVLARETTDARVDGALVDLLANVTLVERPVRQRTLVSVVRAALRARRHHTRSGTHWSSESGRPKSWRGRPRSSATPTAGITAESEGLGRGSVFTVRLPVLPAATDAVAARLRGPEAALDFRPDLVLLDIGLPGLSGYEVARRFRADQKLATTILVAVTGWGTEEDQKKALEAGFDIQLTKPIEMSDIEMALAKSSSGPRGNTLALRR